MSAARLCGPRIGARPTGVRSLLTRWWPPPSSTVCSTTPPSSTFVATATGPETTPTPTGQKEVTLVQFADRLGGDFS